MARFLRVTMKLMAASQEESDEYRSPVIAAPFSWSRGSRRGVARPSLVFAQNKNVVQFTLPWVAEGSNLFTFVAKGMGYRDKHRLDVEIARGSGSLAAAQAIGETRFDFRMCSPSAAILRAVKGRPMVALATCAYDATMGIGVLSDGPIKSPKDLEGRQMASTVTSREYPFLPAFAEKAGFTWLRSIAFRSTTRCATVSSPKARSMRSRDMPAATVLHGWGTQTR